MIRLLAAKVNYFGLTGSIETWKQLQKDFIVTNVIEWNDNIKRQVLVMKMDVSSFQ
jgi:hypothetical protein